MSLHIVATPLQIRFASNLLLNRLVGGLPVGGFELVLEHGLLDLLLLAETHGLVHLRAIRLVGTVAGQTKANAHGRLVRIENGIVVRAALVRQTQRFVAVLQLVRVKDVDRFRLVAVQFDWSIVNLRDGLNLDVIAVYVAVALPQHIACDVLGDELRKVLPVLVDVVHGLVADHFVHVLVAVDLQRNRAKQTSAVFGDIVEHQAASLECRRELLVAFHPVGERERGFLVANVLVAAVVAGKGFVGWQQQLVGIGRVWCAGGGVVVVGASIDL